MSPSMILAYLPALCYILNTSHLSHIISNNCNKFSAYKPVPTIIKLSRIRSNYVKSVSNGSTSGELPLWEDTPESVQKQIRAYGPDPPEDVFRKPVRPLGFWGRMMAPDMSFMGVDRAVVVRNMKKKYQSTIYRNIRRTYKRYVKDAATLQEVLYWKYKLDSLPRDSSPVRFRRRCIVTGRSRGVIGIFGMCRHKVREFLGKGWIPGVSRASW